MPTTSQWIQNHNKSSAAQPDFKNRPRCPDIEDTYDLCKSAEGDTYYLRLRVRRTGFVTALEDSNKYAGEDRVLVRGGWEFGEAEPATTVRVS